MNRFFQDKFFKLTSKKNGYFLTHKNQRHITNTNIFYDEAVRIVKDARMEKNPLFHWTNPRKR